MNLEKINEYINKIDCSNFEESQFLLKDPAVLDEFDKFLANNYLNVYSSKVLLTSFIIKNHKSKIFDNNEIVEEETKLIEMSNEIVKILKLLILDFDNNIKIFKELFIKYNSTFSKWKEKDEKILINELIKIFWELELNNFNLKNKINNQEDIEKNKDINLIKNQQEKILERIKFIGGEKGLEHFNNYVPVFLNEDYLNNLFKEITDNYHKAYWDILRQEISVNNFSGVLKILKEIKMLFKNLLPNKLKFHNELDEYIDIDFLDQLIKNNVFEPKNIYNLVFYIINNIKKLQSPSDDNDTEEWESEMKKNMDEGFLYKDFLPTFFKVTLDKLIKINNQTNIVRNSEIYNNIKNKKL